MLGERMPIGKTRDFLGTPRAPQEIALATLGERTCLQRPVSRLTGTLLPR
jgi:hypothetical protein